MTGGCGFIGSHLVDLLFEHGCRDVLVLDNLASGCLDNLNGRAVLEQVAIESSLDERMIVGFAPDVVFHLAAQTDVQTSVREPLRDAETNVLGTIRVAEAAYRAGARLVFASTGGAIYGECDGAAAEGTVPEPQSPYAVSKLAGEGYVRWRLRERATVVRYANVYGPRQSANLEGGVVAVFLNARRQGEQVAIFGDGLQTRDFVHVSDVVEATVAVAEFGETFNVGTGTETRVNDLAEMVGVPAVFAPARAGDLRRSCLDSSRLRTALGGWEPLALADGLAVTAASLE